MPWLSVADLFLLPSAQESFGLAALEAMACEVPVVASNVGGLPEIIEDGVTGFVCPPEAVEMMAERGIALLTDAQLRESIGRRAARDRARALLHRARRAAVRGRVPNRCWREWQGPAEAGHYDYHATLRLTPDYD